MNKKIENKEFGTSRWKMIQKVERYFQFDTLQATMKKEIIGGLATFLAVCYILSVEPSLVSASPSINGGPNMSYFGIFLALCIASFIGTFAMGLFANMPVALAPSMGLNVMFTFSIASVGSGGKGIGYEGALIVCLIASILFFITSVTPIRKVIIQTIPEAVMIGIGIAIGFFIAYVGLNNMGWFQVSGGVPVASMGKLKENYPQIILGMGILCLMLLFQFRKINGGVAIAMLAGLLIAIIVANAAPNIKESQEGGIFYSANFVHGEGWHYDFGGFTSNIKNTWTEFVNKEIWQNPITYISIFILLFLNFFDATGTLATFTNSLDKETNGSSRLNTKSDRALLVDSSITIVGSALGTTPMAAYIESQAGVHQGARTGFSAIITSFMFLLSIALFPIFKAIPMAASGAASVYVGIMMISSIMDIDWRKPEYAIPVFLSILFTVTTYAMANGIAIGLISYSLIKIFKGQWKELNVVTIGLPIIFIAYFVAYAFIQ